MRRVHREGLDGTGDGNEAWHTAEWRKRPCVRPATVEWNHVHREGSGVPQNRGNGPPTVETGSCSSGGVWRTAKRRKRTSYGRNGGPIDREGCGVPQNGGNKLVLERYGRNGGPVHRKGCGVPQNGRNGPPTVETGVLFIGRGVAYRKMDSTGYCSSPPSTSSSLHGLPSTSSSLHGLVFIQPPPRATPPATVQPPLHRLLFIQPSTTPRGHVHPEATLPLTVHPKKPLQCSLFIPEAASIGFSLQQ